MESMESVVVRRAEEDSDIEHILGVVRSYSPSEEEWQHLCELLAREFEERRGNRQVYIAWDDAQLIGVYQLVLNNADNDSDLADSFLVAHVHHLRIVQNRRREGLGRLQMLHARPQLEPVVSRG